MSASITYQEAVKKLKSNHRLSTEAPDTYPHIIEDSIAPANFGGRDAISYIVDNGRSVQESGWIYEADYPAVNDNQ